MSSKIKIKKECKISIGKDNKDLLNKLELLNNLLK